MAKVYGFSLLSLLAIETAALLVPTPEGSKVIWNVVVPVVAATGVTGSVVTVKSEAFAPPTVTFGVPDKLSAPEPVLQIVKVLTTVPLAALTLPKSVWSVVVGVVSPLAMGSSIPLDIYLRRCGDSEFRPA